MLEKCARSLQWSFSIINVDMGIYIYNNENRFVDRKRIYRLEFCIYHGLDLKMSI